MDGERRGRAWWWSGAPWRGGGTGKRRLDPRGGGALAREKRVDRVAIPRGVGFQRARQFGPRPEGRTGLQPEENAGIPPGFRVPKGAINVFPSSSFRTDGQTNQHLPESHSIFLTGQQQRGGENPPPKIPFIGPEPAPEIIVVFYKLIIPFSPKMCASSTIMLK